MSKSKRNISAEHPDALFGRVVSILEQAQGNVVRAVNTNMVLSYWFIGREIVEELQGGEERAEYGKKVVEDLSARLTERYGKGFSEENLQLFRRFYRVYCDRVAISYPPGTKFGETQKSYPAGTKSGMAQILCPPGGESGDTGKMSPLGIELPKSSPAGDELPQGFSPQLTWSHYRALMRVENVAARDFYEREAAECGWSKVQLERQIHSFYYDRIVANRGEQGLLPDGRERLPGERVEPSHLLKSPMVLEFLGLPESHELHESRLEQAIIDNLQNFLLELGKGFSFVARQKHIRFGDDDFYVDLVFYNYVLKCFLLLDLKMGKLTHADIGQMDGYVRLYEDRFKIPGDNPTIGLLLCSDKSEAVAKYSILNENKQIFASKYLPNLPTEEQLRLEIERERHLIESALEDRASE
ncbi:MAG: PDDEXK nuclease domain-containing protein [Gallionella sp.]|nr:PDDEXK nuclease domain-containing protein [Gallionella sp.]